MKIYNVKVNGKVYEVEIEKVSENNSHIDTKIESNVSSNLTSVGSKNIIAPIAGKVINVKVNVGDNVKKGDTVIMIEAMKLENEIQSQFDGKVVEIKAIKGNNVSNGDVLIVLN